MSQKLVYLLTVMGISAFLLAGSGWANENSTAIDKPQLKSESLFSSVGANTPMPVAESSAQTRGEVSVPNLDIKIGDKSFTFTLYDNASAQALLAKMPLALDMRELNGNEKYYYFTDSLPTDPQRVGSVKAGDLMLYGSDCLVLFYKSFSTSYSYTKLGHINDASGLADTLGKGDVLVTFTAGK